MSMSTPGNTRRPTTKPAAGAKPAAPGDKPSAAAKTATKKVPAKSAGGGKGRKPMTPVKVSAGRNWGPIALFAGAGVVAVLIIAFGAYSVIKNAPDTRPWATQADDIDGIANFRASNPKLLEPFQGKASHEWGPLTYQVNPPVGGTHNFNWQNCMGDVYTAPIPKEHAVHSLEHGAVWVTYRPDLAKDQVDALAKRINGQAYTLMSPYPGLDAPISLQAWGFQLKVDNASDPRIGKFIQALRTNASMEPGASCSEGINQTGDTPFDIGKNDQPAPQPS